MIYWTHCSRNFVWGNNMEIGWLDSHVHLMDDSLLIQIDDVIKRAKENDVFKIMLIAMSIEEIQLAFRLMDKYDMLDLTAGFHPQDAHLVTESDFQKLEKSINTGKIKAIGEIGLDYYWDKSHEKEQIKVFKRQIELSIKYNLPISIHMRDSTQDVYDIIKSYEGQLRGVMHCYSGSLEMAKSFIKQGFFISFGGILTFKNAKQNVEVAKQLPLEWILTETDGPYLTPHPFRGKLNEPMYVKYVGEKLAQLKESDNFTIQSQIMKNYKRLFY